MALNVTQQDAYAEACKAIGELVIEQRLLAAHVAQLEAAAAISVAADTQEESPA